HYTLRFTIGAVRFDTAPVELQINSDGQTNALARDKLFDALLSPLIGSDGGDGLLHLAKSAKLASGVVRGYNGSQIFDTTYATTDPGEPQPCGVSSGASYWLSYQ